MAALLDGKDQYFKDELAKLVHETEMTDARQIKLLGIVSASEPPTEIDE